MMLNGGVLILALDGDRAWKPPIVLIEALRGENVAALWEHVEAHRAHLETDGLLEERRGGDHLGGARRSRSRPFARRPCSSRR